MLPRVGCPKILVPTLFPCSVRTDYHQIGSSHRRHHCLHAARGPEIPPAAYSDDPTPHAAPSRPPPPLPDRRTLLSLGLAAPLLSLVHASTATGAAAATGGQAKQLPPRPRLKSISSARPALLRFINSLDRPIKVYWVNYDADEELFAFLPAGTTWEVDTFETHPWRVRDAASNDVLVEIVASAKEQDVDVTEELAAAAAAKQPSEDAAAAAAAYFEGFDGVGGREEDYGAAEISEIALDHLGGVALLSVAGFSAPVPLSVAGLEAAQLFHAAGIEFRRPTTIHAWARSLAAAGVQVERSLITRVVGTIYYSRVVIRTGSGLKSVDARPSDAVALAMAAGAPIFVARRIARAAQPGSIEGMALRREAEPPTGRMPAAIEGGNNGEEDAPAAATAPPPPRVPAGANQA